MWVELAKDHLRRSYRAAVTTLIACGIDEKDAELAVYIALFDLEKDLSQEPE